MKKAISNTLLIIITVAGLTACEKGPAENVGEKIDKTMTDLGNKAEDACEDAKEGIGVTDTNC